MKKSFLLFLPALLSLCMAAACKKDTPDDNNPSDPDKLTGVHYYEGALSIDIGTDYEKVDDGTIDVDFDERSFYLYGGDEMSIEITIDTFYRGVGIYTFTSLGQHVTASGADKEPEDYDWQGDSGSMTITENTAERIKGTYKFTGRDFNDKKKTVEGSFDMPKQ